VEVMGIAPPLKEVKMARFNTIPKSAYLTAAQLFHWATADHFKIWFTGSTQRHRRTEVMLPRLVRQGKLRVVRYGRRLVYSVPRRTRGKRLPSIEHGLGCTEGLVRFFRAKPDGLIIPERFFRGFGVVPEWGILYPDGTLLLYEFSIGDNFYRSGLLKNKLIRYRRNLGRIEDRFGGRGLVLFVVDIPQVVLERFLAAIVPTGEPFYFTDYQRFRQVPIGDQLKAPIYL